MKGEGGVHRLHEDATVRETEKETVTATAAALCARLFLGQDPDDHAFLAEAAAHLQKDADPALPEQAHWTSLGLYQLGGREWKRWSAKLNENVVQTAVRKGRGEWTWEPAAGLSRLETAAFRTLTLQIHYRYTRFVR